MAVTLDWPLSRKEKEVRLVDLFQNELAWNEAQCRILKSELAQERRRASLPASSPSKGAPLPMDILSDDDDAVSPKKLSVSASVPTLHSPGPSASSTSAPHSHQMPALMTPPTSPREQNDQRCHAEPLRELIEVVAKQPIAEISGGTRPEADARTSCGPTDSKPQVDEALLPPLTRRQTAMRLALIHFYKTRQINGQMQANRIARMLGAENCKLDEADIWASVCLKYNALPVQALGYLSKSLPPYALVQWPKEKQSDESREAVDRIQVEDAGGESSCRARHLEEVQHALKVENNELLSALIFRGCPSPESRPPIWGSLLRWQRKRQRGTLPQRRETYRKLRLKATQADLNSVAGASIEIEAYLKNAKNGFRGEAFLSRPDVNTAVKAIAGTIASRYGRYMRGSCEMAVLLLFVMSNEGTAETMDDAEADAFWCLSQIMLDMNNTIVDNTNQAKQCHHIQYLLRLYDPILQEILRVAGIVAMPTTRLGVALCTRAGFSLSGCARLWDAVLADPKRFEFVNYTIVATLLLSRESLIRQRDDSAALAEAVLAAPRQVEMDTVLSTAYAICAFERRCCDASPQQFPPRPGMLEHLPSALEAVGTSLSSAFGKVRGGFMGLGKKVTQYGQNVVAAAQELQAVQVTQQRTQGDDASCEATTAALEVGLI